MPTTTIGTFHSAATSTGNGSSLAVPSGDIVLNVSLVGSGPIGAVIQPQVSAGNSTWVDLQPSTRIAGAGSVSSMVDVATTAAYIRVVLSEISGTNAAATVTLASFAPAAYASLTLSPDGSLVAPQPLMAPEKARDPGSTLQFPDPRRPVAVVAKTVRGNTDVSLRGVEELFVIGSNSSTTTNAMSASFMGGTATLEVLADGAALASATKSIHNPPGEIATINANTNATGIAVALGRG